MRARLLLTLLVGAILGAGGTFGFFYAREMQRFRAYEKHTADRPDQHDLSLFDPNQLYALRLLDPSGRNARSIRDSKGRVLLLNLWASWCQPCIDEFASFERLQDQMKGRVDFYFLTDEPPETMAAVARRYKLPFYSHGSDRSLPPYLRGQGELPRTYIIRDDRVVLEFRGAAAWDTQGVALLEKVLAGAG